jgi:Arc/MetJ family transcription regulator
MYSIDHQYVHMIKRVTIELDEEILEEAKKALGQPTMRATVEEALSRAINQAEVEVKVRQVTDFVARTSR